MIEPYYQIFKEKLKEVKFKDMKTLFPTVDKFVKEVNPDLEKKWIIVSNCLRQRWSYD
jgi:hypothetical protein